MKSALFPADIADARGLIMNLSHDTFPLQFDMLEIQKQGQLEFGDGQISDHLTDVGFVESLHHLGIGDHQVINYHVWHQIPDYLSRIMNRKSFLLINFVASIS